MIVGIKGVPLSFLLCFILSSLSFLEQYRCPLSHPLLTLTLVKHGMSRGKQTQLFMLLTELRPLLSPNIISNGLIYQILTPTSTPRTTWWVPWSLWHPGSSGMWNTTQLGFPWRLVRKSWQVMRFQVLPHTQYITLTLLPYLHAYKLVSLFLARLWNAAKTIAPASLPWLYRGTIWSTIVQPTTVSTLLQQAQPLVISLSPSSKGRCITSSFWPTSMRTTSRAADILCVFLSLCFWHTHPDLTL